MISIGKQREWSTMKWADVDAITISPTFPCCRRYVSLSLGPIPVRQTLPPTGKPKQARHCHFPPLEEPKQTAGERAREKGMQTQGEAAPTGCYKCGRPGHWSRDCPFSPTNPNPDPNLPKSSSSNRTWTTPKPLPNKSSENPKKKLPRTRPKLTPELLLSNDGLGFVLRHFPRSFKYHGRGEEVSDLGNLIGLYAQWHSHLIPYYAFDQFVRKVEQVGATRRVRACIRELKERVSNGGDPTKLHEPPVENVAPDFEPGHEEAMNMEGPVPDTIHPPVERHDAEDIQEDVFDEIYRKATKEPSQSSQNDMPAAEVFTQQNSMELLPNQAADARDCNADTGQLTNEQKGRMEANRLKALEKIASQSHSSVAT